MVVGGYLVVWSGDLSLVCDYSASVQWRQQEPCRAAGKLHRVHPRVESLSSKHFHISLCRSALSFSLFLCSNIFVAMLSVLTDVWGAFHPLFFQCRPIGGKRLLDRSPWEAVGKAPCCVLIDPFCWHSGGTFCIHHCLITLLRIKKIKKNLKNYQIKLKHTCECWTDYLKEQCCLCFDWS